MSTCQALRRDGSRCPVAALEGQNYCIFHSPLVTAETRKELRSHGGRIKTWEKAAGAVGLSTEDVLSLIQETIENLRGMPQDARTANAMLAAARLVLDVIDYSTMGEKAAELEELLKSIQGGFNAPK